MYYKIVTPYSWFTDLYVLKLDMPLPHGIPYGAIFTAPEKPNHKPDCPEYLINESCFHFADGVLDAMLWHSKLSHHNTDYPIYAIEPLSHVVKQRCHDSLGIYQCGANKIRFLAKQNIDEMYEMAIAQYNANPKKYANFEISLDWWKKHQTTLFYIHKYYFR